MESQSTPNAGSLNEYQARRLRVTCQYIDKLLCGVEEILNIAASKAAFPRYSAMSLLLNAEQLKTTFHAFGLNWSAFWTARASQGKNP